LVCSSAALALTITRSPNGFSFIPCPPSSFSSYPADAAGATPYKVRTRGFPVTFIPDDEAF
jgi:hypothetical protein